MKIAGKITLSLFLLLILGIVALHLWRDQDLAPGPLAWLKRPASLPEAQNLYYSLLGFGVPAEQDPHTAGKQYAAEIAQAIGKLRETGEFAYELPADTLEIPAALRDSLCKVEEKPCLAEYAAQKEKLAEALALHKILLDRYLALRAKPLFQDTSPPTLYTPIAGFSDVMNTHRLYLAGLALAYQDNGQAGAIRALQEDIAWQRQILANNNQLIAKMVFSLMLARDLHLFAQWLDAAPPAEAALLADSLTPLSAAEKDLEPAMRSEFQAVADSFRTVGGDALNQTFGAMPWLLEKLLPYKANASLNRLYPLYHEIASLSQLPDSSALPGYTPLPLPQAGVLDYLYNPIGTILEQVVLPDFSIYVYRVRDLDGLMRLVRLKQRIRAEHLEAEGIKNLLATEAATLGNPYTTSPVQPMQWDGQRLYFETSLKQDKAFFREVGLGL